MAIPYETFIRNLMASPTGRQLASDGTHMESVYGSVAELPLTAGDGAKAVVSDGVTASQYVFVRPTGWIAL